LLHRLVNPNSCRAGTRRSLGAAVVWVYRFLTPLSSAEEHSILTGMKANFSLVDRLAAPIVGLVNRLPLNTGSDPGPFISGVIAGAAKFLTFAGIFLLWWAAGSSVATLIGPGRDEIMIGGLAFTGLIILIVWAVISQGVTRHVMGSANKPSSAGQAVGLIGTPIFLYVVISLAIALVGVLKSLADAR
jgi:hypothetical protein